MRFVLFPGYVESKNDGDVHWVTAEQLHWLYMVKASPYIVVVDGLVQGGCVKYTPQEGDVACLPRYDGEYPFFSAAPGGR